MKESTKNLTKVLKDNPNIQGNIQKISQDRVKLLTCLMDLNEELLNKNQFISFSEKIQNELDKQDELDLMKVQEHQITKETKRMQEEIKQITQEHQNEYLETC